MDSHFTTKLATPVHCNIPDLNPSPLYLCGIRIHALTLRTLLELIEIAVKNHESFIFLNHNLHSLYLYETDPDFRAAYSMASYVYVDGVPVIWLGRLAGLPVSLVHRITFLDSFEAILSEASKRGWRVFYLGSTKKVNERAIFMLRRKFPRLRISGQDGFLDENEAKKVDIITKIIDYRTDILFVGMGMPNQERWLSENHQRLRVSAVLTSGATLDYVVGQAYKPPAWAGPLGLYGVMRLASDPLRLWRRYLFEPLVLAKKMGFRLLRQRMQKQFKQ